MHVINVTGLGTAEAEEALGVYFPGVTVGDSQGGQRPFKLELNAWAASGMTYLDHSLGGRPIVAQAPKADGLMLCRSDNVRGSVWDGRTELDVDRCFAVPDGVVGDDEFAHCTILSIDEGAVERHLRARGGHPARGAFRLTHAAPRSFGHDVTWRTVMDTVETAMQTGFADDSIAGPLLVEMAVAACLACFANNWEDAAHDSGSVPATIRRARAFIEENAHRPITVADVAEAARLSIRGLQAAFLREVGSTPLAHLRRVRLDGARRDLLAADPTRRTTVADIARRWGFGHLGRFSGTYRDTYGELPSDTLRR